MSKYNVHKHNTTDRIKRGGEVKCKYHGRLGISVLSVNGQVVMAVVIGGGKWCLCRMWAVIVVNLIRWWLVSHVIVVGIMYVYVDMVKL